MRNYFIKYLLLVSSLLVVSGSLWAHHGQSNSFDTVHMWTTWATVEDFSYINPHPALKFTRTDKSGNVEHWAAEVNDAPARLARSGWTKSRSLEALKPGTRVKLYLATSLAGGFLAFVDLIENEKGEIICSVKEQAESAADLDGVPGGYQPKPADDKKE
ncbi:MAG: DUF6152 family protein, partial [Acidobacteriota bacterium]|nr:DUF6152 family protein [Acidobacteriota bacterium]